MADKKNKTKPKASFEYLQVKQTEKKDDKSNLKGDGIDTVVDNADFDSELELLDYEDDLSMEGDNEAED